MAANRLLHHDNEQPSLNESDIDDAYVKAELDELEDSDVEELGDSELERILKKRGMYGLIEKKKHQPKSLRLIQFVLCLATVAFGAVLGRLFFKPGDHSNNLEKREEPDSKKLLKDFHINSDSNFGKEEKAVDNAAQTSIKTHEKVNINKLIAPRTERNRDPRTRTNREHEKRTREMSRGWDSKYDRIDPLRSEGRSRYDLNSPNAGFRPDPRTRVDRRPPPEASNDIRHKRSRQLSNERGNTYDRDLNLHGRASRYKRSNTQTVRDNYQGRPSSIPRSNVRSSRAGRSSKKKSRPAKRTRPQRIKLSSSGRG